ncbi:hypothetical protein FISHEDRAFT_41659 [Fistulina hepatica ATCC 64428]|nr:hypothetical protein FISHEDRAFT_41659 [Fistulina hepatica ATCC 64428]
MGIFISQIPELAAGEKQPPTNFSAYVISVLAQMKSHIDQAALRRCLELASSFLVTDTTMHPEGGVRTWYAGFDQLVEVIIALHARRELEPETVSVASKACSECWGVSGAWKGIEEGRDGVRKVATKLKKLLDEDGRTYRGEPIYAPG